MAVSFWVSKILFLLVLFHCLEGQLCYWKEGPEEFAVIVLHLENRLWAPSAEIWTSYEKWESYAPGHLHCELFIKWFIICWFIIFRVHFESSHIWFIYFVVKYCFEQHILKVLCPLIDRSFHWCSLFPLASLSLCSTCHILHHPVLKCCTGQFWFLVLYSPI